MGISGEIVAMMMRSRSLGCSPAAVKAFFEASVAISELHSSGRAILRSWIPVRVTIHSSVVSTNFSMS